MKLSAEQIAGISSLMRECGATMRSAHDLEKQAGRILAKPGDANFVTVYDVRVQEALIAGLSAMFPGAAFLAEEKENGGEELSAGLCFVIDPIDGTTNFIHDMRCSAISVGVYDCGEPVFGAVLDPYRDELFSASAGGGAYLNGAPIRASDRALSHALVSIGTTPYERQRTAERTFAAAKNIFMRCADIRRSGSAAIDICFVACGRTDAFFEDALSPWDFAAGGIILTEAGGRITDFSGAAIQPGKKSGVLCTNGLLHAQMLALLHDASCEERKSDG